VSTWREFKLEGDTCIVSKLDETYRKIIETLEKNVKDEKELDEARKNLDDLVKDVIANYDSLFQNYDDEIKNLKQNQIESKKKIDDLENRIRYFEKLMEMEDYDVFVTCPYCGLEFQTEYDEEIVEIPCPECGRLIEIDWSDDEKDEN